MYKQSFGSKGQIKFTNEHEFYTLLGYLAKSNGSTSLVWEHNENQGAWGSEGRIQVHINNMPNIGQLTFTAGNGSDIVTRINCNEFVKNICTQHGFTCGKIQNIPLIRGMIPIAYVADFDKGLNM